MIEITMPRLSDTMEEGAIATWHKKPGDTVEVGDILVEIETDKATMEYEAYEAGTLSKILVQEGELVSIGTPIAELDDGSGGSSAASSPSSSQADAGDAADSDGSAPADATADDAASGDTASGDRKGDASAPEPVEGQEPTDEEPEQAAAEPATEQAAGQSAPSAGTKPKDAGQDTDADRPHSAESDGERQFASPLVRKLARDHNLDLSGVTGSGPGGRIIRADIDHLLEEGAEQSTDESDRPAASAPAVNAPTAAAAAKPQAGDEPRAQAKAPAAPAAGDDRRASEAVPMSQTRRVIARRLGESARSIPHFYVTAAADAEALMDLRADLNTQLVAAGRPKVSVNDLLIRASALALREHPLVNASYVDDSSTTMLVHHRVNVGVAVASENGLVVPVIDDADQKTVTQLGAETKELVGLANAKKLTPAQMSGGTFTISNLGMFGVEEFTAIINPPEGAILAVGGTKREPTVVDDTIVPRYRMRYTLSADHRVIDGALAAQFLQTLTRLIENPWTIIA